MQGVLLLGAAVLLALPCHGLSNVVSLNASDTLHVARLGRVFDPPAGSVGFGVGVGLSWLGGGVQVQAQGAYLVTTVATAAKPYRLAVYQKDNMNGHFVWQTVEEVPPTALMGPTHSFVVQTTGE
jgi:hypothetical protein